MTLAERQRLARAAIPARWLLGFGLAFFLLASVLGSSVPLFMLWTDNLSLRDPPAIVLVVLKLEVLWTTLCGSAALFVGLFERAVVRGGLTRRAGTEPILAAASCYLDASRWSRPSGVILVTETHVEVAAYRARNAAHDLLWPLSELDGVVEEIDPLLIGQVGDVQGLLVLSRGEEHRRVSVVRRRWLLVTLSAAWDQARAARPGAGATASA